MLPTTLISASPAGSATDLRTSTCAASCTTTSQSAAASRMSITCSSARGFTFAREPVERSSTMLTRSPRAISASTMCEPMKPAPPVTRTCMRRASSSWPPKPRPHPHGRAEDDPADVRPPGDARDLLRPLRRRQRQRAVEELHGEPHRDEDERADLRHCPIDNEREKRDDARRRPQHEERAEQSGDAPRGADRGDDRLREEQRVREASGRAERDVKEEVADVPERILDGTTEDPEIDHVSEEVHDPAVQEKRRDERDRDLEVRVAIRRRIDEARRDVAEGVDKRLGARPEDELGDEDGRVGDDERARDDRRGARRLRLAKGNHFDFGFWILDFGFHRNPKSKIQNLKSAAIARRRSLARSRPTDGASAPGRSESPASAARRRRNSGTTRARSARSRGSTPAAAA